MAEETCEQQNGASGRMRRFDCGRGAGEVVDIAGEKSALRKSMRARLATLRPAQRALEEELVTAAIQDSSEWRAARTVLLYRSVAPEFSTLALTLAAWRVGKRTLFPRVRDGDVMTLHEVRSWGEMRPGKLGIPEPTASAEVVPAEVDLAIIPGVAWTTSGQRLGRGGGHFDRLLRRLQWSWGVGFDCQILDSVPEEPHDRMVQRVWSPRLLEGA